MVGMGTVGFLDDYLKIRHRRSLGLNKTAKLVGQLVVGVAFAVLAINFPNVNGVTPASTTVSYVRDIAPFALGTIGFVILAYLFIAGFSNAVNLTDGLDGLAAGLLGDGVRLLRVHLLLAVHPRLRQRAHRGLLHRPRPARRHADRAAAAWAPASGFLWWNTSPARIFMGDTGSLALGGLLSGWRSSPAPSCCWWSSAGCSWRSRCRWSSRSAFFRATRRRVFRMAPLHHHFELAGWTENTVIVRFWLVTGMAVAFGIGLFYADWLDFVGL